MPDTCEFYVEQGGSMYCHIPSSGRHFRNFTDWDGKHEGWKENPGSWMAYTRHITLPIDLERVDAPIPAPVKNC